MVRLRCVVLPLLLVMIFALPASAQLTAYVKYAPLYPLPNDHVRGELIIKTGAFPEKITGVSFVTSLDIHPREVSGVGLIPADSEYTLPFTLIAPSPGVYTVEVYIYSVNNTLVKTFNLNVVNTKPEIVLTTPLTLGEVNNVHFTVYNPIDATNIKVTPLFKAYPSQVLVLNNQGSFEFYPEKKTPLKFRIEFYDAFSDNYHSYVQVVYPSYKESSGVYINASTPHTYYLLDDVIPVNVQISNLRGDSIYSVFVNIKAGNFNKSVYVPSIQSGSFKRIDVECPADKNSKLIDIIVKYTDSLGTHYTIEKHLKVRIINRSTVSVSDISVVNSTHGFEITGDVSNSGWSKVYSVVVTAVGKKNRSYFVGTIDPSDYDTFDIVATNASKIVVTWQNALGKTFSTSKSLTIHKPPVKLEKSNTPFIVSVIAAVFVLTIVFIGIWKSRKSK